MSDAVATPATGPEASTPPAAAPAAPAPGTPPPPAAPPAAAPPATPPPPAAPPAAEVQTSQDAKAAGEPPSYSDFKVPEGMTLDKAMVDQFTPIAKELNLNQDQAQKVVDLYAAAMKGQQDAWNKTLQGWLDQTKADKEIGGQNLESTLRLANGVLDKFGSKELREAGEKFGFSHNPDFVRFLSKIGKAMGEDTLVTGSTSTAEPAKSVAQKFYPGMNP